MTIICEKCGMVIGETQNLDLGGMVCVDCALKELDRIMRHQELMEIQQNYEDAMFAIYATNKGTCTYLP